MPSLQIFTPSSFFSQLYKLSMTLQGVVSRGQLSQPCSLPTPCATPAFLLEVWGRKGLEAEKVLRLSQPKKLIFPTFFSWNWDFWAHVFNKVFCVREDADLKSEVGWIHADSSKNMLRSITEVNGSMRGPLDRRGQPYNFLKNIRLFEQCIYLVCFFLLVCTQF